MSSMPNTDRGTLFDKLTENRMAAIAKEHKKMLVFLEYYKLEISQVLPIVQQIVKKAKTKSLTKPDALKKSKK